MNIFDIMGPIMIGPSSSHTAGAARIGLITRTLLGAEVRTAEVLLHGSFAATGTGHGTDKALVAGLLGLRPDSPDLPRAFTMAKERGIGVTVGTISLRGAHPNTAVLRVTSAEGATLEVCASSLGGGRVRVNAIDGLEAAFSGDCPTLIIRNEDRPGQVAEVTGLLYDHDVNLATMQLFRDRRGGLAVMVLESDEPIGHALISSLRQLPGIVKIVYLNMEEG